MRNGKGIALQCLAGTCGLLGHSCGHPELPRGDADEAPEVTGEVALVREAGAGGDLRQGKVGTDSQELLGSFDAAGDELASDSAASRPTAPPAVSSASTADIAARRCGRSRPSSGGTVSRAGSRPNASAPTRATNPGSRKLCSWSLHPLERTRAGLPAGTSEIDPAGGGPCRFTPSYRRSSSSGGRAKRTSVWWVMTGWFGFRGGRRAVASRLQAHPAQPVARRARLEREDLEQVKGPERAAESRRLTTHDRPPPRGPAGALKTFHACRATRPGPYAHYRRVRQTGGCPPRSTRRS
jgi:hypothetical protein